MPQREPFVGLSVSALSHGQPRRTSGNGISPLPGTTPQPGARPAPPEARPGGQRAAEWAPLGVRSLARLPRGSGGGSYLGSTYPRKRFAFTLQISLSSAVLAKAIAADIPSEENSSLRGAAAKPPLSPRPGERGSEGVPGLVRGIWGVLSPVPVLTRSLLRYRAAPPAPRPAPSPSRAAESAVTVN